MSTDFNKVLPTENYAAMLQTVTDLLDALAQGLDPAVVTPVNTPTNALRWELTTNKRLERFNGAIWETAEPAGGYAINISGSAAKWGTGRTITLTGDMSGVSGAFDGSGNLSFATTLATVGASKGGTGQTGYTVGDLLYASGAASLSKLADVAAGNVLLSGGVGAAPGWGKVGLTTHVSGSLGIGNGGTGATTAADARTNLGLAIGTNVLGMGGGTLTGALTVAAPSIDGGVIVTADNILGGSWGSRIISRNTNSDAAVFTGIFGLNPIVAAHNYALSAWSALYVNTINGVDGGGVIFPGAQITSGGIITAANLSGTNTGDEPAASTTVEGVLRTATPAEARGKSGTTMALTPSNLADLVFESAEQALATGVFSVAHGLGVAPKTVELVFRCKTAENGYSVGDEIVFTSTFGTYGGVGTNAWNVWGNATNAGWAIWQGWVLSNKTTGVYAFPTLGNWRLVLRAYL